MTESNTQNLIIFFVTILIMVMSYTYIADQINTLAIAEGASSFIVVINLVFPYLYFTVILGSLIAILWKVFD
jgi:hypothetical protein